MWLVVRREYALLLTLSLPVSVTISGGVAEQPFFLAIFHDISDQQRIESELRSRDRMLQSLANAAVTVLQSSLSDEKTARPGLRILQHGMGASVYAQWKSDCQDTRHLLAIQLSVLDYQFETV